MKRLLKSTQTLGGQAVFLAASTGGAQAMLAILYLLAARGSTPAQLGSAVSAIAIGTSAVGFIDFGTNSHWVREIARGVMDRHELGARLVGKLLYGGILTLLWLAAALVLTPNSLLWTAGPVMFGLLANQSSQVALRGSARGDLVALTIICDRTAATTLFVILNLCGFAPSSTIWFCLMCGSFAAAALGWSFTDRHNRPKVRGSFCRNPWRGASFYGVAALAGTAQSLDLPLLSAVSGGYAAGLYGAVNRWTQPISLLASAFSGASAPFMSRSAHIVDAWKHVKKAAWMPLSAVVGSIAIAVFSPQVVSILLGNTYTQSGDVLRILAVATFFSILSQPLMVILQSLGRDRYVGLWMAVVVAVQLSLVAVLAGKYGATGAAYASLVVQILLFLALGAGAWAEHRRSKPLTHTAPKWLTEVHEK